MWQSKNGQVQIRVSPSGRRSFHVRNERTAGGSGGRNKDGWRRVREVDVRSQFPGMRLPSANKILERTAGRQIEVYIRNDAELPVQIAFYNRDGNFLRRVRSPSSVIITGSKAILKGPQLLWTTRQYIVAGLSSSEFPTLTAYDRVASRAARIGFNVSKTFTVTGADLDTLQIS